MFYIKRPFISRGKKFEAGNVLSKEDFYLIVESIEELVQHDLVEYEDNSSRGQELYCTLNRVVNLDEMRRLR